MVSSLKFQCSQMALPATGSSGTDTSSNSTSGSGISGIGTLVTGTSGTGTSSTCTSGTGTLGTDTYRSYFSMASTQRQRPSQALDTVAIFSGTKSGLVMYLARITFVYAAGMLS